jgi:hypothetical protein
VINLGIDFTKLPSYNDVTNSKGAEIMTDNEKELINIIEGSNDPEKVAEYMLNLFLDYLRTHGPSQETPSAVPQESA